MHKIIATIREIPAAALPTVRDIDGAERPATDAELLNFGLQRLAGDVFSCVEQYRSDHDDLVDEADGRLNRVWWHERDDSPWASEAEKRSYPRTADAAAQRFGPGRLLGQGGARERFGQLDPATRRQVLQARVIRAAGSGVSAAAQAEANVLEQATMIEEFVGDVERTPGAPEPLVDFDRGDPIVAEAQRLLQLPDSPLERRTVSLADVDDTDDVVEARGIIPHSWAGERLPHGGRLE